MQWKDEELNKMLPFVSESTLKIKVINPFKNKQNMDVFVFSGKRKEKYYEEWVLFLQKLNGIAMKYNWKDYVSNYHHHPLFKVTREALTGEALEIFERNTLNDCDVRKTSYCDWVREMCSMSNNYIATNSHTCVMNGLKKGAKYNSQLSVEEIFTRIDKINDLLPFLITKTCNISFSYFNKKKESEIFSS